MSSASDADVAELLALDGDALALWLLERLDGAPPGEREESYIGERLAEWLPESRALGAVKQLDQFGLPKPESVEADRVERALRDAYSLLMSRGLIRPDPTAGKTFCVLTETGNRQLADAPGHDRARVAFAAKALTIELHPALKPRNIDSHFRQGRFETALREGATFLEDAIRVLANLPQNTVGVKLASSAFAVPNGKLTDPGELPAQAAGLQQLFMGFFGAVRNLVSHTGFRYADPMEAFDLLMLVDLLTRKLGAVADRLGKTLP